MKALSRKTTPTATTTTSSSGDLLRRNHARAEVPPVVGEVLDSPGRPLEPSVRRDMEQRTGHDFGSVRVHADGRAAESAEAVGANAYTVGNDIVFNRGQYAPRTHAGRRLLAHELTHTIQQRLSRPALQPRPEISHPGDAAEAEADRVSALVNGPARPPVNVAAAPSAALMRDKKDQPAKKKILGLGPHEAAEPVTKELEPGFKINMEVVANSEKVTKPDGSDYYRKKNAKLPGPEVIPRVQNFLKIDLVFPRIANYLTGGGTHRITQESGAAILSNPSAPAEKKKDLVYNPAESWNKIISDLTRAVAKWQEGWNAKSDKKVAVNGGISEETYERMKEDGLVETDAKVWAQRDEQEWGAVREDERRFWRKRGEAGDTVRDKIVGLAMSQIGKVSEQDRGDRKKFGWQRILRYYEVAYGAADAERKEEWLRQNFEFDMYEPLTLPKLTPEEEERVWGPGMEGLGPSGHYPSHPLGPRPDRGGMLSQEAQKETADVPPNQDLKKYEQLKKEQSAWYTSRFGKNLSPEARKAAGMKETSAYRRTHLPLEFSFSEVEKAKDAGPWSWCAIFTMWAVKSVTGRGIWDKKVIGLKDTVVSKPSDFKGARRGDILYIHSHNQHHVILAKDPSPDPTEDELLEAVEGNIEIQGVRHSKRWRVKNVARYYSAVD